MINIRAKNFKDETGNKYGRLTVICIDEEKSYPKHIFYKCRCDCGNSEMITVGVNNLRSGNTISCGCFMREQIVRSNIKNKKIINTYDLSNYYGICYSSNTGDKILFDLEDYNKIKDYCWEIKKGNGSYKRATTTINGKIVTMAYVITKVKRLDHIDRNPLNNQKSNFRNATYQQNSSNRSRQVNNTSGVTGVTYENDRSKWKAFICFNRKTIRLGSFDDFNEAVKVRLIAEKEYFGEFASQKHLFKRYGID